jgi:hypothetical protein
MDAMKSSKTARVPMLFKRYANIALIDAMLVLILVLYFFIFPLYEGGFYQSAAEAVAEYDGIGEYDLTGTVMTQGKIFALYTNEVENRYIVVFGTKAPFFRKFSKRTYLIGESPLNAGDQYDSVSISGQPPEMRVERSQAITGNMISLITVCAVGLAAAVSAIVSKRGKNRKY